MQLLDKERDWLVQELVKLGVNVQVDEERKRVVVNDTYEISYTNFYYFEVGQSKSISRGRREFIEFVKQKVNEM